ncbi:MAG: hypothetical protein RL095_2081 [Verrucomicrobiota bacterium]
MRMKTALAIALSAVLGSCVTYHTTKVASAERVKVEFESDEAKSLFYEVMLQKLEPKEGGQVCVGLWLWIHSSKTLPSNDFLFNETAKDADLNKDGILTLAEIKKLKLDASLKSHRVAVEAGLAWGIAPGFERERVPPRVSQGDGKESSNARVAHSHSDADLSTWYYPVSPAMHERLVKDPNIAAFFEPMGMNFQDGRKIQYVASAQRLVATGNDEDLKKLEKVVGELERTPTQC